AAPEIVTRRTLVRAGKHDTVTSMAHRYKVSASQVAEWNKVGSQATFKAGQHVVLFLPVRVAARAPVRVQSKAVVRAAAKAPLRKPVAGKKAPAKLVAKRR